MTPRRLALLTSTVICLHASFASAEPIFKAHKYSGPIPQNSISLRVGMFGGAENQEMIDFLDVGVQQPFTAEFEDFGTGLTVEATFVHKPHPRFGWRANAGASFFSYTSEGDFIPQVEADSLLPQLLYDRELSVQLFVLEASGVYYFADASQEDLQTYVGAGFSLGFPHEEYTETFTDVDTGGAYTDPIPGRPSEASEWDFSAGVHALLGVLYYVTDRWGVNAEGRVQFMEGKFDQLQAINENGDYENVGFVIDYSGYYLSIGATYGF
jgi:hypothetical protein